MRGTRRIVTSSTIVLLAWVGVASPTATAVTWAPAATATIRPGVQLISESGQCTANFIFTDSASVYIGSAAHCTSTGGPTDTDGCRAGSLPIGTPITIGGASKPGTLAYNSWLTMQAVGESDPDTCAFNDLALVRIDPADVGKVNPSVPHWGGPTGLSTGTAIGQTVYSYGNSSLRLGLTVLSPKTGLSLGDAAGGWHHSVYMVTPGIPGDSGSAYLDSTGRALGVLSTVGVLPVPGANGVGDLRRELDYLHAHTSIAAQLALGTEPFNRNRLLLGL